MMDDTKVHTYALDVLIDDNHILTFTTPDGQASHKQYPMSWSNEDIMADFVKTLNSLTGGCVISVNAKSVEKVHEA